MLNKETILFQLRKSKPSLTNFGIDTIGLFGSVARNENNINSDIDILIDFKEGKETFDNLMLVSDLFEQLFKQEKVEIVTKKSLSKYLKPYILNEVIYV